MPGFQLHSPPTILSIHVGRVAPLGGSQVLSGFVKAIVNAPVRVAELGLEGDEQADLTVHGGRDKAVYLYPSEHYLNWKLDVPRHERMFDPGALGENLATTGVDEASVSIGDVFEIGSAEVQVTQPRHPCFKLGIRFNDSSLGRVMLRTGRTGWYVRVLKTGVLGAGNAVRLLHRPNPKWTVARLNALLMSRRDAMAEFAELASLEGIADVWKQAAEEALRDSDER